MNGGADNGAPQDGWKDALRGAMEGASRVDVVGVGNELRGDDAAGLLIASALRSRLRKDPRPYLRVHPPQAMPERLLSKLAASAQRIMVLDAVEAGAAPGEIVCDSLRKTKYGFFATHNVPLRLVPGLAAREDDVYVVGVQPVSLEVGEGVSAEVSGAIELIVEEMLNPERGRR